MRTYADYVARLRAEHGDKFDDSLISQKFAVHFGQRVEVKMSYGEIVRGYVVGTSGWLPSLMLLRRRDSTGSSWLINDQDELVKVLPSAL